MTDQTLLKYAATYIKKHSSNGVFMPSQHKSINATLIRRGLRDKALDRAGCKIEGRHDYKAMTDQERLKYAISYIRDHAIGGVFKKNDHDNFCSNMSRYGCFQKALELAGATIGTHGRLGNLDLITKELISKMFSYRAENLDQCKTINQLIATYTIKHEEELLSLSMKPYRGYILNHLKLNFPYPDYSLDTFTWEQLEELTSDKSIDNKKNDSIRTSMVKYLGGTIGINSYRKGIFFPYMIGYNRFVTDETKDFFESIKRKSPVPKTLLDWCSRIWSGNEKYHKATLFFLTNVGKVDIKDFTYEQILAYEYDNWGANMKQWRSDFAVNYVRPLIKIGVLPEGFLDKSRFNILFREHIETRDKIAKNERTVLWYGFEQLRDKKTGKYSIDLESSSDIKKIFLNRFEMIKELKAKEFTGAHQQEMRERGGSAFISAIHLMMEDGLCPSDVFGTSGHTKEEIDPESDHWSLHGISYDFTRFEDSSYRKSIKVFIKSKSEDFARKLKFTQPKLEDMVNILTELGAESLHKVNRDIQRLFCMKLAQMCISKKETYKARDILKTFRGFVHTLRKIDYADLNASVITKNDSFSLPQVSVNIVTYNDSEMRKILKYIKNGEDRLTACAFGLTALLARRIGEICSDKEKLGGIKVNALSKIGLSNHYALTYEATKQNKIDVVLLSDLVGNRTDPFAVELIELSINLFEEAKRITKPYRHLVPDNIKDCLFIEKKPNGGYGLLNGNYVRVASKKLYKEVGIDTSKTLHMFRHTMATNIILSGGTIADAADALGDSPNTVAHHYHQFIQKIDTLRYFAKIGRSEMVQPLKDSKFFKELQNRQHKVVSAKEMSEVTQEVAGGRCAASVEDMLNCQSYMLVNGESGCPGCKSFRVVAEANKAYWETQRRNKLKAMDTAETGSWWFEKAKAGFEEANQMVLDIEQKELEDEFGV